MKIKDSIKEAKDKIKKVKKHKRNFSVNKIALLAIAGAAVGFAVVYLMQNDKAKQYITGLSDTVKETVKSLASKGIELAKVA